MAVVEQFLADLQHDVFSYQGLGHQARRLRAMIRAGAVWLVEDLGRTPRVHT